MSISQEEDFLEVDALVRGQNYCLISFISPEQVLNNKEIFKTNRFLANIHERYKKIEAAAKEHLSEDDFKKAIVPEFSQDFEHLQERFKDFVYVNSDKLETEFYEKNDFKTTVRGVKVRGCYDTLPEAQSRAKKLQSIDPNFSVYIGQVGYWLPWDPNPHAIDNQEYAEPELNTLVKEYRKNQDKKDEHFQENLEYAKEQSSKSKIENSDSNDPDVTVINSREEDVSEEAVKKLEETDPWLKQKEES